MKRAALLAASSVLCVAVFAAAPAAAAPAEKPQAVPTQSDISAQSRPRVRPQIRVTPRPYPYRNFHTIYPLPYDTEYPGPNAVRQCVDAYVTELRPSGTVIVPRMRCRWVTS